MVTPARSATPALESLTAHPYSDLLVHHMGPRLADEITQGLATGDMFRTTPLRGVGQRRFLLHDGRSADLLQAIEAHASPAADCDGGTPRSRCYGASEANAVIERLRALAAGERQAIPDFLHAL
jgi:CxxC motif-containing protein (DUF1111 family)